jgi:cyclase
MLKNRLIPCLFLRNGFLVRSEEFTTHQILGNPYTGVQRYNSWNVDELIYIDISREKEYDLRRDDWGVKNENSILKILEGISKNCFMPLTFGGGIRSCLDIRDRLAYGADRVTINTKALEVPEFVEETSRIFGSQCIIVSIDVKKHSDGTYEVFSEWGTKPTGWNPVEWARTVAKLGAGEIFLNSIDRDGTGLGYDLELVQSVASSVDIPLIACGGVGQFQHFVEGIEVGASAVSAGNIFHFTELSDRQAKKVLAQSGVPVRV